MNDIIVKSRELSHLLINEARKTEYSEEEIELIMNCYSDQNSSTIVLNRLVVTKSLQEKLCF